MIRSELVQKLCTDFPDLTQREVEGVVSAIFDSITDQLAKGGRVELRGFGAFSTRQRDGRVGRNPRTGEAVSVDAKRVPYFKPGKEMRERLTSRKSLRNSPAGPTVAGRKERTWRNGRRWGLKILFPIGSAGSNPAVRTIASRTSQACPSACNLDVILTL